MAVECFLQSPSMFSLCVVVSMRTTPYFYITGQLGRRFVAASVRIGDRDLTEETVRSIYQQRVALRPHFQKKHMESQDVSLNAAKMNMYGALTREVTDWFPEGAVTPQAPQSPILVY